MCISHCKILNLIVGLSFLKNWLLLVLRWTSSCLSIYSLCCDWFHYWGGIWGKKSFQKCFSDDWCGIANCLRHSITFKFNFGVTPLGIFLTNFVRYFPMRMIYCHYRKEYYSHLTSEVYLIDSNSKQFTIWQSKRI